MRSWRGASTVTEMVAGRERGFGLSRLAGTGLWLAVCAAVMLMVTAGSSPIGPSGTARAATVDRPAPALGSYRDGFVLLAFRRGVTEKVRAADTVAVGAHVIRSFIGGT
jgi:hypothetical protein